MNNCISMLLIYIQDYEIGVIEERTLNYFFYLSKNVLRMKY